MVERFFRDLTDPRIRRGLFRSVSQLTAAIEDYLAQHNQQPTPFIWPAGQHAQQQRAQHVAFGRCVGTAVVERTILDPILEQAGGLEEFDEVGHLPEGGHGGVGVPAQAHRAAVSLHGSHRSAADYGLAAGRSLWVKLPGSLFLCHRLQYQLLASPKLPSNCRI